MAGVAGWVGGEMEINANLNQSWSWSWGWAWQKRIVMRWHYLILLIPHSWCQTCEHADQAVHLYLHVELNGGWEPELQLSAAIFHHGGELVVHVNLRGAARLQTRRISLSLKVNIRCSLGQAFLTDRQVRVDHPGNTATNLILQLETYNMSIFGGHSWVYETDR